MIGFLRLIRQASRLGASSRLDDLVKQGLWIADQSTEFIEKAEFRLNCACIYVRANDCEKAADLFRQATILYRHHQHNFAIASWLYGAVLWQLPASRTQALLAWRRALNEFNDLASNPKHPPAIAAWYRDRSSRMQEAIAEALLESGVDHVT